MEVKEKKARVEDALHASRAAVEEGIVAGDGVALLRARASISIKGDNREQDADIKIVMRALGSRCAKSLRMQAMSQVS